MTKVKLIHTINVYPELYIGIVGEIKGSSKGMDSLLLIYFPSLNKTYKIFENNLELFRTAEEIKEYNNHLNSSYNIKYTEGPHGGFKYISYDFIYPRKESKSIRDREEGHKMLDFFRENGIPVKVITLPRKTRK